MRKTHVVISFSRLFSVLIAIAFVAVVGTIGVKMLRPSHAATAWVPPNYSWSLAYNQQFAPGTTASQDGMTIDQSGPAANAALSPTDTGHANIKPTLRSNMFVAHDSGATDGSALVTRTHWDTYQVKDSSGNISNKTGYTMGRGNFNVAHEKPPFRIEGRVKFIAATGSKTAVMWWPDGCWNWEIDWAETFGDTPHSDVTFNWHKDLSGDNQNTDCNAKHQYPRGSVTEQTGTYHTYDVYVTRDGEWETVDGALKFYIPAGSPELVPAGAMGRFGIGTALTGTRGTSQSDHQEDATYIDWLKIYTGTKGSTPPSTDNPPSVNLTAPAASASVSGSTNVAASASDDHGVASVKFQYKAHAATSWTTIGSADTSSPYSVSWNPGTLAGGNYDLRAVATDTAGQTTNSATRTVTVASAPADNPPSTPTGLSSTSHTKTSASLAWTASRDDHTAASGLVYHLHRVDSSGTTADLTTAAGATTYTDNGLTAGTTYSYTVAAEDAAHQLSAQSAAVALTTTPACSTTPDAPSSLSAAAASATTVSLSWLKVSAPTNCGINHYVVSRNGVAIATPATLNYSDSTTIPSTTYSYTVAAVTGDGIVGATATKSVTTPSAKDTTPPPAPGNFTGTAVSGYQINLSWSAVTDPQSGIQGYNIYRDGTHVGWTGPSVTSFGDTGLSPNTTYKYEVRARNGVGLATASVTISVTTPPQSLPPVSGGGTSGLPPTSNTLLQGTQSIGSGSDPVATTSTTASGTTTQTSGTTAATNTVSEATPLTSTLQVSGLATVSVGMLLVLAAMLFNLLLRAPVRRNEAAPATLAESPSQPNAVVYPTEQVDPAQNNDNNSNNPLGGQR